MRPLYAVITLNSRHAEFSTWWLFGLLLRFCVLSPTSLPPGHSTGNDLVNALLSRAVLEDLNKLFLVDHAEVFDTPGLGFEHELVARRRFTDGVGFRGSGILDTGRFGLGFLAVILGVKLVQKAGRARFPRRHF